MPRIRAADRFRPRGRADGGSWLAGVGVSDGSCGDRSEGSIGTPVRDDHPRRVPARGGSHRRFAPVGSPGDAAGPSSAGGLHAVPFHTPTGLADGLGLESGLGPNRSLRPGRLSAALGPPFPGIGRRLGCNTHHADTQTWEVKLDGVLAVERHFRAETKPESSSGPLRADESGNSRSNSDRLGGWASIRSHAMQCWSQTKGQVG